MPWARRWICSALLAAGCAYSDPGVIVEVAASPPASPATFTTDRGDVVTLTRAYVVVKTVEIFPCPTATWRRVLRELVSLEGTAQAHDTRGLDLLADAMVEDLLRPPSARPIGVMPARASAHCVVNVVLGPADDETQGMPEGVEMSGVSIYLEGWASRGGEERPFVVTSRDPALRRVSVEAFAPAKNSPRPGLMIEPAGLAHWLDGVDLDAPDGARALANAAAALQVRVTED